MPVIGVCNQKGGSGNSSTIVHLYRWLQAQLDLVNVKLLPMLLGSGQQYSLSPEMPPKPLNPSSPDDLKLS